MTMKTNKGTHQDHDHASYDQKVLDRRAALAVRVPIALTADEVTALKGKYGEGSVTFLLWRVLISGAPEIFMPPKEKPEPEPLFRFEDLPQA